MHLTLRARAGVPSLRDPGVFGAVREAIGLASGAAFRVVHFSVQADHVHLIVEAAAAGLSPGARGISIRMARAINRTLGRRGAVWGDRYHARTLRTPGEVRQALVYVLMNFRKHRLGDRRVIDPCSSACWFDGFRGSPPSSGEPPVVCPPRTWLGSIGWRRRGLIDVSERPTTSS